MHTDSSAYLTWGAMRSASLKTATVAMPISREVRKIRRAISPRLATSSLLIFGMITVAAFWEALILLKVKVVFLLNSQYTGLRIFGSY